MLTARGVGGFSLSGFHRYAAVQAEHQPQPNTHLSNNLCLSSFDALTQLQHLFDFILRFGTSNISTFSLFSPIFKPIFTKITDLQNLLFEAPLHPPRGRSWTLGKVLA